MLTLPKAPKVTKKEKDRAVIEIEELYPGYGYTMGNALRRALYSSLPGAAITSFKMEGVSHEFATMEGILEDAVEISLNIKQINLTLHGDEPQTLKLKVKGSKEVKAKDIETPSQVEIVNKDAHIATLTNAKSSIDMELQVERGMGYVQTDKLAKDKKDIGVIRLDAAFSPIKKANFEVENMRVGDRTDYNRLVVDITTDGTIDPEKAFKDAAETLVKHFELASQIEVKEEKKGATKTKTSKKKAPAKKSTAKKSTAKKSTAKKTTRKSPAKPKAKSKK